jgi:DNA-binding response OmpR family regulator
VKSPVYYLQFGKKDAANKASWGTDQMTQRRILVVEDEKDIADLVALHLGDLCDELQSVNNGYDGLRLATSDNWDLIILDLMLPGPDGLEICRTIRRERPYQPVLMLTSKSSELDRVLGLETGADDYITKPFSVLELVARVRAIFRRVENLGQTAPETQTKITVGILSLDLARREVLLRDRHIELTAREFDLLVFFARHPGRVFRRAELLDQVWGYGHEGYEHTVNSHINRLRAKIEQDPSSPELIVTVWGVGYKFALQTQLHAIH